MGLRSGGEEGGIRRVVSLQVRLKWQCGSADHIPGIEVGAGFSGRVLRVLLLVGLHLAGVRRTSPGRLIDGLEHPAGRQKPATSAPDQPTSRWAVSLFSAGRKFLKIWIGGRDRRRGFSAACLPASC